MPEQLSLNQNKIARRIEARANRADDFFADAALDILALAIAGAETLRERPGFGRISGEQQAQSFFGILQSACGIESGRELEAYFISAHGTLDAGDFFQSDDSRDVESW